MMITNLELKAVTSLKYNYIRNHKTSFKVTDNLKLSMFI